MHYYRIQNPDGFDGHAHSEEIGFESDDEVNAAIASGMQLAESRRHTELRDALAGAIASKVTPIRCIRPILNDGVIAVIQPALDVFAQKKSAALGYPITTSVASYERDVMRQAQCVLSTRLRSLVRSVVENKTPSQQDVDDACALINATIIDYSATLIEGAKMVAANILQAANT